MEAFTLRLIRLTAEARSKVSPEFLAWQINHHDAQAYLSRWGQGSAQHSVTKQQLRALPVALPDLARQALMVAYHRAAREEATQLQALIENRALQMQALGSAVLAQARAPQPVSNTIPHASAVAGHH